jgi:hypothetical protein
LLLVVVGIAPPDYVLSEHRPSGKRQCRAVFEPRKGAAIALGKIDPMRVTSWNRLRKQRSVACRSRARRRWCGIITSTMRRDPRPTEIRQNATMPGFGLSARGAPSRFTHRNDPRKQRFASSAGEAQGEVAPMASGTQSGRRSHLKMLGDRGVENGEVRPRSRRPG